MTRRSGLGPTLWRLSILLTIVLVVVPLDPALPSSKGWSVDLDWMFAVDEALARGLVFGRDVVFTYGPYIGVYSRLYHPETSAIVLIASSYFAFVLSASVLLNLKDAPAAWQAAFVVALAGFVCAIDGVFYFFLFSACVSVVEALRDGRSSAVRQGLLAIVFSGLGFLPLVKCSFFLGALAVTGLSLAYLVAKRRVADAVWMLVPAALSMVAFWLLAHQPLTALPAYLISALPFASAFSDAMGFLQYASSAALAVKLLLLIGFAAAAALACRALLQSPTLARAEKAYLGIAWALVLFLSFKGGFVRYDWHVLMPSTTVLLCALMLVPLGTHRKLVGAIGACIAVALLIDVSYFWDKDRLFVLSNLSTTYRSSFAGVLRRADGAALRAAYAADLAGIARQGGFPPVEGRTDVYPYFQGYSIAAGHRWSPRPVLHSYTVYTPALIDLNHAHLRSAQRPDHVFFGVRPIDGRLPMLEDGLSWLPLLANYHPVSVAGDYLQLSANPAQKTVDVAQPTLAAAAHAFDERIALPPTAPGDLVFAKLAFRPSVLGSVANAVYRSSALQLTMTLADGQRATFRIIPSMAGRHFLLSPLVEDVTAFRSLYDDGAPGRRVDAIAIEHALPHAGKFFWTPQYTLELCVLKLRDPEPHCQH